MWFAPENTLPYYGASRNTATLPVEFVCWPWTPVESIPTCSGTSLETVRVCYTHVKTSHALLGRAASPATPSWRLKKDNLYTNWSPLLRCVGFWGTAPDWRSLTSSDKPPTGSRWRRREAIRGAREVLAWSEMTLIVSRHVPDHVGILSTGHHGSHATSTGHVTGEREIQYTASYSPERTI